MCTHLLCISNFRVRLHLTGQTTWSSVASALVIYIFCATVFKFNLMLCSIIKSFLFSSSVAFQLSQNVDGMLSVQNVCALVMKVLGKQFSLQLHFVQLQWAVIKCIFCFALALFTVLCV